MTELAIFNSKKNKKANAVQLSCRIQERVAPKQ